MVGQASCESNVTNRKNITQRVRVLATQSLICAPHLRGVVKNQRGQRESPEMVGYRPD